MLDPIDQDAYGIAEQEEVYSLSRDTSKRFWASISHPMAIALSLEAMTIPVVSGI